MNDTSVIDCHKHGSKQETHCIHPRMGWWMCKKCFEEQYLPANDDQSQLPIPDDLVAKLKLLRATLWNSNISDEECRLIEQAAGMITRLEAVATAASRLARECNPEDVYGSGLDHAFHELDAFKLGVKP